MKFVLHHVGNVVSNILDSYTVYQKLGFSIRNGFEEAKDDTEQKVRVGVLDLDSFTLELLEPLGDDSPVASLHKKGGGLHHICYSVDNMEEAIQFFIQEKQFRQVTKVTRSVWDNRPVVFFYSQKDNQLIELIEL